MNGFRTSDGAEMFRLIAITRPDFFPGEAARICQLLEEGFYAVHLRKPTATAGECAALLDELPAWCRRRIVVHDHFGLCPQYGLLGVHLNGRNPLPPTAFTVDHLSRSCHSLEEVQRAKPTMRYVTLSPIFDSISKQGYASAFTPEILRQAAREGLIDRKVVALGGVTPERLPLLKEWGFGGAAMLGCLW